MAENTRHRPNVGSDQRGGATTGSSGGSLAGTYDTKRLGVSIFGLIEVGGWSGVVARIEQSSFRSFKHFALRVTE
jgi:hypothetical protein